MVFKNSKGEDRIHIGEELSTNDDFIISMKTIDNCDITLIERRDGEPFNIGFVREVMMFPDICTLNYNQDHDIIIAYDAMDAVVFTKEFSKSDIGFLELDRANTLILNLDKLPMFKFENDPLNEYPKFELNISDCTFNIKIYLDEDLYFTIPQSQLYYSIDETMSYLSNLVHYLTKVSPVFIIDLCQNSAIALTIKRSLGELLEGEENNYEYVTAKYILEERGIHIISKDEDQVVDYHTFFKLLMDGTWEASIIDPDEVEMPEEVIPTEPKEIEEFYEELRRREMEEFIEE